MSNKIGNYNTIVYDIDPDTYTANVSFNEVWELVANGITVQFRIALVYGDGACSVESTFVRNVYKGDNEIGMQFTTFTGYVDAETYTDPDKPIVFSGF